VGDVWTVQDIIARLGEHDFFTQDWKLNYEFPSYKYGEAAHSYLIIKASPDLPGHV